MPQPKRPIDRLTEETLARANLGTTDAQIYLLWAHGIEHLEDKRRWLLYPRSGPAALSKVINIHPSSIRVRLEAAKSIMAGVIDHYLFVTSLVDVEDEERLETTEKLQYGITVAHGHKAETVIDDVQKAVVEGWALDSLGRRVK